jgi:hypothetical protein
LEPFDEQLLFALDACFLGLTMTQVAAVVTHCGGQQMRGLDGRRILR